VREEVPSSRKESHLEPKLKNSGSHQGKSNLEEEDTRRDKVGNFLVKNGFLNDDEDQLSHESEPDGKIQDEMVDVESDGGIIVGKSLEERDVDRGLELVDVTRAGHLRSAHGNLSLKLGRGVQVDVTCLSDFVIFDVKNSTSLDDGIKSSEDVFGYVRHL